jgi:hypothetical protein
MTAQLPAKATLPTQQRVLLNISNMAGIGAPCHLHNNPHTDQVMLLLLTALT